jgi:hypothetical protein
MASLVLTSGRKKICKDSKGGVRSFYLASYKKILRSELVYDGIEIFEFPETFVYKFECLSGSSFQQTQQETEGGKFYNQSLNIQLPKITAYDNVQFQKLLNKEYFCLVEDNNGNFFLLGFRNGAICDKLDVSTDNVYKFTFEGMEEEIAPYCNSIVGTGIVIIDFVDYILQNGDNYAFEDNSNYIL